MKVILPNKQSQAGFTLVELAIVMIIIGLLISGVLKGQELIANAQVTSTVAQAKAMDAATSTFRDTYNALPGDMGPAGNTAPGNRLPNCTGAPCNVPGNGDGRLGNTLAVTPVGAEGERFFVHLNAANLLSGIVPGTATMGGNFPNTKIGGNAFEAGSAATGAVGEFNNIVGATAASPGIYLATTNAIGIPAVGLKPSQALRIDTKLDDADPSTGDVRANGTGVTCGTAAAGGVAGFYATTVNSGVCGLYIKIQN